MLALLQCEAKILSEHYTNHFVDEIYPRSFNDWQTLLSGILA